MNRKHLLIMLLCCAIPIAVLGVLLVFKVPISLALIIVLMLACPLSNWLIMLVMKEKCHMNMRQSPK